MSPGPYELSPGRIMPLVYTNTQNVTTVTQLSRTPRTLNIVACMIHDMRLDAIGKNFIACVWTVHTTTLAERNKNTF